MRDATLAACPQARRPGGSVHRAGQSETDDGLRFSDADMVNHMIFMLMAAHDTSRITLSTLTYELGRNTL
jgi:cytochrome P450